MKRILTIAILCLCTLAAIAQKPERSPEQRQQWLTEIRNAKQEFITKDLGLTASQRKEFFALYDEMDAQLTKINEETRELERRALSTDKKLSDTEYESIARALFSQKNRESEIELKYFDKFKEILTPQQLVRLKNSERKFTQGLLRHGKGKGKTEK